MNFTLSQRKARHTAFTLVEMLVVVGIIGLLLALGTPYMVGALQANRLTTAGEEMMFKISSAQQIAMSENRSVELRLYSYSHEGGPEQIHSYQLFLQGKEGQESKAIESATDLTTKGVAIAAGSLSPLSAASNFGSGWPKTATGEPWTSKNAKFVAVMFNPDGSTNINAPLRTSYLTMVSDGDTENTSPANFYTVQIDPITGRAKSYRPN